MMSEYLKNRRFQIVYNESGIPKLIREDGHEANQFEQELIQDDLEAIYGFRHHFIYIAEKKWWLAEGDATDQCYKIGMTNNPERREREIQGTIIHRIPCDPQNIRKLERDLHLYFYKFHVEGEWFRLNDDPTFDFLGMLMELNTEKDLSLWLNRALPIKPGYTRLNHDFGMKVKT